MDLSDDIILIIVSLCDFASINRLSQTNSRLLKLYSRNQTLINKYRLNSLHRFIDQNITNIRQFALDNSFGFDYESTNHSIQQSSRATMYDKYFVDLMYLVSFKLYDETEYLLRFDTRRALSARLHLFEKSHLQSMPQKLRELFLSCYPNMA